MKMKSLAIMAVTGLMTIFLATTSAATEKPNIVLINMDNFGYGELGVYGGGIVRGGATPRIDKLATEGMRLLNYNVEAQCTPSRAALMTGRYAIRTGNGSVPLETAELWFDPVGIHHAGDAGRCGLCHRHVRQVASRPSGGTLSHRSGFR